MSAILVQHADREPVLISQTREAPLQIGRHSSNEVVVPDPQAAPLDCRISWNRKGFEVTAATPQGVLVNGTRQRARMLRQGDIIQVGTTTIWYVEDDELAAAILRGDAEMPDPVDNNDTQTSEPEEVPQARAPLPRTWSSGSSAPPSSGSYDSLEVVASSGEIPTGQGATAVADKPDLEDQVAKALERWGVQQKRPGEQDLLRSPLVVSLSTGTVVLLLASLTLWFVIGRNVAEKAYRTAVEDYEQQRFSQAIGKLEEFLKQYPSHVYTGPAKNALGLARIEQALSGATPNWDKGVQLIDEFSRDHRRSPDYNQLVPKLATISEKIALGAADAAATLKQRPLLQSAAQAKLRVQQFHPADKQPTELLADIDARIRKSEAALLKYDTLQTALTEMATGLKDQKPFTLFEARRKLLLRYPDLANDKAIRQQLTSGLTTERSLVQTKDREQAAETAEYSSELTAPPLTLSRLVRSRIDLEPSGQNTLTIIAGTCFAADLITGQIQWRRQLGEPHVFAPVPVRLETECVLVWDAAHSALLLIRTKDGGLVWRQKCDATPVAAPLTHAGQIFLPLSNRSLLQLDAVTGRMLAELTFSQNLASTPVSLTESEHLLAVGQQGVFYTLTYRPLACVAVTYSGHANQACVASPLSMGKLLLTAENDRQNSALLRVWFPTSPTQPLEQVASARIQGQVFDPPILRGKQLIVPAHPERLAAFTVSETKDQSALTPITQYQVDDPQGGPIYPVLGPNDDLWMTSSRLRRMQVTRDAIVTEGNAIPLGIAVQPVQVVGNTLFATSRSRSNSAAIWLAVQRQQMTTDWQSTLAARPLLLNSTPASDGSQAVILDSGEVFSLTAAKLQAGGIDSRTVTNLPLPVGLTEPLGTAAYPGGILAAWCGGTEPKFWLLNADGVQIREIKLPGPLQAAPIPLAGGWLLPVEGRLRVIEAKGFTKPLEDYLLPIQEGTKLAWRGCVATEERLAVAVTTSGRVIRLQARTEPVPHLAEVVAIELGSEINFPPLLLQEHINLVTPTAVQCLDAVTFEVLATLPLEQTPRSVHGIGDFLVVETVAGDDSAALILEAAPPLKQRGKLSLSGAKLAGATILGDQVLLAGTDGTLHDVTLTSGETRRSLQTGLGFVAGPWMVGGQLCVATQSGGIQSLNSWWEKQP